MRHRSNLLLVRRARDGDEKACEALVQKYYPEIYRYCLMHLSDAYEAEDLTQEVFTSFFAQLYRYREYGKTKNYLYTIAGNRLKNYYKKEKAVPLRDMPDNSGKSGSTAERSGDIIIRLDVKRAVQNLPEEIREVAILFFFQEWKQREIAEQLQITLSLVKYRIGRARELLQKELEDQEVMMK